jgi:hypothetical protein
MAGKRQGGTRRRGMAIVVYLAAAACASVPPPGEVHEASGRLASLRVEEAGPPHVVLQLDSEPDRLFGFDLGGKWQRPARQGMLDLLSEALAADLTVTIGYTLATGREEGVVVRASATRPPEAADTVRVVEVAQFPRTGDDPIVRGVRLDPRAILATYPPPPPELADEGAHELLDETTWAVVDETELGPGQTQEKAVSFAEPVLLQARANWFGGPGPLALTVSMGASTLGTGAAQAVPPDRGVVALDVRVQAAGTATVSLVNRGSSPVKFELVVGVVPLSVLEE